MDYLLFNCLVKLELVLYNMDWKFTFNILQGNVVQQSRFKILFAERLSNVQAMHYQCFEALVFG